MNKAYWPLALAVLCVAHSAWADDDDDARREDPWEYDKAKDEERAKADQEEEDESERSFGRSEDFVITAERLFGYTSTSTRIRQPGSDPRETITRANLLVNANNDFRGYSAPRLAFDYFVTEGLSIGAALGYSASSAETDNGHFEVAGRVGYALMFSKVFGVWPRAGVTYLDQKFADTKAAVLAVSIDLPLVIVPFEHVAFTVGPTFDGSLVGKINPAGPEPKRNFAENQYGFSSGLSVFF